MHGLFVCWKRIIRDRIGRYKAAFYYEFMTWSSRTWYHLDPLKTPIDTSPSWVSYGVSILKIWEKIDQIIMEIYQSSRMDFMPLLPICTDRHQMLIILTNSTSDIWILRLTKQTCWRDFGKTDIQSNLQQPKVNISNDESCHDDNVIVIGSIAGCHNDELLCCQWWQSCHHNNCWSSAT